MRLQLFVPTIAIEVAVLFLRRDGFSVDCSAPSVRPRKESDDAVGASRRFYPMSMQTDISRDQLGVGRAEITRRSVCRDNNIDPDSLICVRTAAVKRNQDRVVLFERDARHPNGEIFLYGRDGVSEPILVWPTSPVLTRIVTGDLELVRTKPIELPTSIEFVAQKPQAPWTGRKSRQVPD